MHIQIKRGPINPSSVINKVRDLKNGAVVTFIGTVRNYSDTKAVVFLEFQAYKDMAENKLKEIGKEVGEKWGITDIAISHRVGKIGAGEIITVIAVGSPHRKEAFEACQYIINELKKRVPLWKKEVYREGEQWIEGQT